MITRPGTLLLFGLLALGAHAGATSTTTTTLATSTTTLPAAPDADLDGIPNPDDTCATTPTGETPDAHGCSLPQRCPCGGPRAGGSWASHGRYVRCVAKSLRTLTRSKRLASAQAQSAREAARKASCGRPRDPRLPDAVRCCVPQPGVATQPFCLQSTPRQCAARAGKNLGAGTCLPTNPCS